MVSSSSAAAQAAENEKRKKQTMEKVKVNHLSRQLQMRLQYARLKVEHGWQKQNLNEVENLYFHNSHLRGSGSKSYPVPTIATAQPQPPSFPPPQVSFAQSRLSFKYGLTPARNSISGTAILDIELSGNQISQDDPNSNDGTKSAAIANHPNSAINMDTAVKFNAPDEPSVPMAVDLTDFTPSLFIPSAPASSIPVGPSESISTIPDDHAATARDSTASPQDGQSPTDVSQSSNNHYPPVKPVRPRSHKVSSTSRALPSLTARDMYNFGSSSTLTYDSFWSSHSGSTTPRPARGASANTVPGDFVASFQVPGDFTSGIQDHSRSSSIFAPSSTSAAPTPTYLEIPRNPGVPHNGLGSFCL